MMRMILIILLFLLLLGSLPDLVIQQRLGLLSKRRIGAVIHRCSSPSTR